MNVILILLVLGLLTAVSGLFFADGTGGMGDGDTGLPDDGAGAGDFPDDNDFDIEEPEGDDIPSDGDADTSDVNDDTHDTSETPDDQNRKADDTIPADEGLMAKAKGYGFTDEEIQALGPDRLQRIVKAYDARIDQRFAAMGRGDKPNQATEATPKGEAETPKPDEGKATDDFEIELDPDLHDPDYIRTFNGMKEFYGKQIAELRQTVATLQGDYKARASENVEQQFDAEVSAVKRDDIFGTGRGRDLDRNGEHFANRTKLWNEVKAMALGYQQMGRPIPDDIVPRAVRSVFGDKIEKSTQVKTRTEIGKTLTKQKGQMISRPSNRTRSASSPEQEALDFARTFFRENGVEDGGDNEAGSGDFL